MWDWRVWNELLREITREARFAVQHEVERFVFALEDWTNALVSRPLPADWRQQTAVFLFHWELEGFRLTPRSIAILDWWLDAWAKRRGWLPKSGAATSVKASEDETMAMAAEAGRPAEPQADVSTAEPIVQVSEPQPRKSANSWPALTPAEEKAAQEGTGLPWWYPIQPRNRLDLVWQKQFENLGQVARDQLLVFFREVAALGRMSRAIADPEDADVDSLLGHQRKVQEAYDRYLQAKIDVHREWTRYLSTEWFIGPEVLKLFEKIDNALPDRVEGFQSPLNDKLKTARRASYEATNKKVRRTDAAYTALVWTDNVIAIIEIATLVGSAKAVFTQTAKKMAAKGLSRAAARSVAVAYTAAHLGTAAASAVVIGGVVPKVLVDAGLDEADVRAGLAVFRALFTIVGLRTVSKGRPGGAKGIGRSGRRTPAEDRGASDFFKHIRMREGKAAEAGRPYPHSQVYVRKPNRKGYWILDYYDPTTGEIVSFKNTQLARVKPKTAIGYLSEIKRKYAPGTTIADVPSSKGLAGTKLRGRLILEVPAQNQQIPKEVLDKAAELDIQIRDVTGRIY